MIQNFCKDHSLVEGDDYVISNKGKITYIYFSDLPKAQYLRTQLSHSAILKEIDLGVISKIISQPESKNYFFFISQERIL